MTSKFARSLYATTAVGFALGFMATPAFAQDATADASATATDDAAAKDDADAKEIVVTGFRASLQSAVNTKKRQDQIVESVSAEDIGKLPDNSIAESIARLPGLAAQRTQGRASIISIRGFGPDFSVTTLNGREQTTTNDSRSVEFDQFPSEVMNQVLVYKSPSADLVPQGLVGTVDLRTIRPLDAKKRVIAVGGRGTYIGDKLMPDAKNKGWRAFATYVDQFADDRVGVALSASYTDEPYQTEDFQAWGFSKYNNTDTFKPDGIKQWFEASSLKRLGLMGTLQAELSDSVMMTWDGFYSNFKDHVNQRGIEWPGNNLVGTTTENGFLTGGTWTGIHPIVEGYANDRDADLYSLGWNTKFDGHNGWKGMVDFAWSRTDRTDHRLESTIGTGYSGAGPATAISYDWTDHGPEFTLTGPVNFGDPSQLVLTDTQGWGWTRVQAGYDAVRDTRDDIKQARAEIERELDGGFISSVKAGLSYADRSKTLKVAEGFLAPGGTGTCLTGSGAIVNTPCQIAIPADAIVGTFDFMRGIGPLVAYDPRVLVDNGTLVYDANISNDVLKRPYKVSEKVLTPYVMATIKASLGASDLTGNIGIQAVHTDQSSEGVSFLANGTKVPTKVGIKYWEYLPSLNLALRQPSGLVFRLALAREMMRARLPDMASNLDYGTNVGQGLIITGSGGNPYIKPYMANAIDFNIEKYFGNKGYISLQTFYKKITRYISRGTIEFDYSDLPPPSGIPPISNIGTLNTLANTKGGKLYGFEVAGTLPFDVFTQSLDGFGLTGGLSYTKTKVRNFAGQIDVIPGYSKWVGNLTAYYEKAGFNVRGSMRYRDGFKGEFRDYKGDDSPQFVLAETIFDAQVGYDFSDTSSLRGLSLYLQGQNLTNERLATVDAAASPDDIAFLRYQTFGRRWVAGFTYKFGAERAAPAAAPAVIPPPPPPAPATQTCADGSVILATDACPPPPPPPPPPAPAPEPERG